MQFGCLAQIGVRRLLFAHAGHAASYQASVSGYKLIGADPCVAGAPGKAGCFGYEGVRITRVEVGDFDTRLKRSINLPGRADAERLKIWTGLCVGFENIN